MPAFPRLRRHGAATWLFVLCSAVLAAEVAPQLCPNDKTPLSATGETRQEEGKTLAEYKCEKGHTFWIAID